MTVDTQYCCLCGDDAITDIPKVLCNRCWDCWIEEGADAIAEGCLIAKGRLNDHIDGCDDCLSDHRFLAEIDIFCPVAKSLEETWLDTFEDEQEKS